MCLLVLNTVTLAVLGQIVRIIFMWSILFLIIAVMENDICNSKKGLLYVIISYRYYFLYTKPKSELEHFFFMGQSKKWQKRIESQLEVETDFFHIVSWFPIDFGQSTTICELCTLHL